MEDNKYTQNTQKYESIHTARIRTNAQIASTTKHVRRDMNATMHRPEMMCRKELANTHSSVPITKCGAIDKKMFPLSQQYRNTRTHTHTHTHTHTQTHTHTHTHTHTRTHTHIHADAYTHNNIR